LDVAIASDTRRTNDPRLLRDDAVMTDFKYLADLLMPGLRSQQMKLQEVDQWLDSLIKTLRERKPVWQDIAHAPKDGLKDILVTDGKGVYMATWSRLGPLPNTEFGWVTNTNFQVEPTHWMPLPEPPK
jgi:hypothetical protein